VFQYFLSLSGRQQVDTNSHSKFWFSNSTLTVCSLCNYVNAEECSKIFAGMNSVKLAMIWKSGAFNETRMLIGGVMVSLVCSS
jgi:hypothetical protein